MLQSVLDPRPDLHQLVPVNQQLAQVPLLRARRPQPWKPALHQQLQNMPRIASVRLLPPHIAGTDLCRIAYPYNVAQTLRQLNKPLAVAARLNPDQRRRLQFTIEPFRFAISVHQLPFRYLSTLRIENRNLLPRGMEITSYNLHRRLLPGL